MKALVTGIAIVGLLLGSHVQIAVADSPPKLNLGPSCDAAARGTISPGRTTQMCLGDERAALDQLTNNWAQYSRAHKTQCVGMTRTGGPSSYVELITCLEIMKDAAAINKVGSQAGDLEKPQKEKPSN